jgi:uncharacterized membrane protein YeaQ/YmgE (transglycosylase-associated protein family)
MPIVARRLLTWGDGRHSVICIRRRRRINSCAKRLAPVGCQGWANDAPRFDDRRSVTEFPNVEGEDAMTLTLTGLLVLLLIAGICGALGRAIGGGTRGGFLISIAVGFVGALLGSMLAHALRLPEVFVVTIDRHPFPVLWSIVGASLFVAAIHFLTGRSRRRVY